MTRVYRILRKAYARSPVDGEGAYRYGGRWSSAGTRLSYTSEHQSLAMLEYFVHLDSDNAPADLVLVTAEIPDDLSRERIAGQELPYYWRKSPAPVELARLGDEFARRAKHCILIVPSALAPNENNWLLNPQHLSFRRIVLSQLEPLRYDPRMFGRQRGRRRPRNI
ncbi:MAG: RES family NAD+ phosphorylase [Candidatus Sulfotelmatobacter sp.]